jgi:hypothetical protein
MIVFVILDLAKAVNAQKIDVIYSSLRFLHPRHSQTESEYTYLHKQEFPLSNGAHIGNLRPRAMNTLHNIAFGLKMFG